MSNPWLKKNPFLSMWLSGANAVLGAARGRAIGDFNRQARAAMTAASKAWVWDSPAAKKPAKRAARRRKIP